MNIIERELLLESKIENSVTYRTANKHIKKNLLGLCRIFRWKIFKNITVLNFILTWGK